MADTAVLKEFLIQLGFKVDESSGNKFTSYIVKSTAEVTAFATAVEAAAALVINRVAAVTSQLEDLYFAAQRTGASAENIRTFGAAAERLGSSVSGARASLEAFRNFLGSTPAAGGLLRSFGIDPTQDPTKILQQFGAYLRTLPEYIQRIRGEQFGLDWHTTLSLVSGDFERLQKQFEDLDRRQGVTPEFLKAATQGANQFNNQLAFLFRSLDNLRIRVVEVLQQRLSVDIQRFTQLVTVNFDKIVHVIDLIARGILVAGDVVIGAVQHIATVFQTLSDWYSDLDPKTQQMVKTVGLLAVGFYLLNTVMNKNPVFALISAILLLIDDYAAYKRGAAHLIPWETWEPEIKRAYAEFLVIKQWLDTLVEKIGGWKTVGEIVLVYFAGKWAMGMIGAFARVAGASGVGLLYSKLGLVLATAYAIHKALSLLDPEDKTGSWIDKNVPGAAAVDRWFLNLTSGLRSTEDQKKAMQRATPGVARPGIPTVDVYPPGQGPGQGSDASQPGVWRNFADAFWSATSSAGNWMRQSFDDLVSNTGRVAVAMENFLASPAFGAEAWPGGMEPGGPGSAGGAAGGGGPSAPFTTRADVMARAAALRDRLMKDLGITREAASAEAGTTAAESGVRSIPTALAAPTNRSAFGMWQETGDRRVARDAFAKAHPELSPEEVDIQFREQEIRQTPGLLQKYQDVHRTITQQLQEAWDQESGKAAVLQPYAAGHMAYGQAVYDSGVLAPPASPTQAATPGPAAGGAPSALRIDSTINVHGVQDPRAVADMVMSEYDRHNIEAIRNAQSAVR